MKKCKLNLITATKKYTVTSVWVESTKYLRTSEDIFQKSQNFTMTNNLGGIFSKEVKNDLCKQ